MIVIIDDTMTRHHIIREWLHWKHEIPKSSVVSVYGYDEAIQLLDGCHHIIEHLFLDHDLDHVMHGPDDEKTGSDIAKHIRDKGYKMPVTLITVNPIGAKNMANILLDANCSVVYKPIFQFQFDLEGVIEDDNSRG